MVKGTGPTDKATSEETANADSTELATYGFLPPELLFSNEDLTSLDSEEALENLIRDKGIQATDGAEAKTGFENFVDKSTLVGVPVMFISWSPYTKEVKDTTTGELKERKGVFVKFIALDGTKRRGCFTDTGYGIPPKLEEISEKRLAIAKETGKNNVHPYALLKVSEGLRSKSNGPDQQPTYLLTGF